MGESYECWTGTGVVITGPSVWLVSAPLGVRTAVFDASRHRLDRLWVFSHPEFLEMAIVRPDCFYVLSGQKPMWASLASSSRSGPMMLIGGLARPPISAAPIWKPKTPSPTGVARSLSFS